MARIAGIDVAGVARGVRDRVDLLLNLDRMVVELLEILRDTHRILRRLDRAVQRFEATAQDLEGRLREIDLSPQRLARLADAVFNIERATLGVETAMEAMTGILPKALQRRLAPYRSRGAAGGVPPRATRATGEAAPEA